MIIQVNKSDNRIISYAEKGSISETDDTYVVEIEVDTIDGLLCSTYEDGKIVYQDEIKKTEDELYRFTSEKEEQEKLLREMQKKTFMRTVSDKEAYTVRLLYDEWKPQSTYIQGDRLMYRDKFYKTLQNVPISQAEHTPDVAVSLYVEIPDPSIEFPLFKQPTGAHDAYMKGDKVTFEEKRYICNSDNVVYSPNDLPSAWDKVKGD